MDDAYTGSPEGPHLLDVYTLNAPAGCYPFVGS